MAKKKAKPRINFTLKIKVFINFHVTIFQYVYNSTLDLQNYRARKITVLSIPVHCARASYCSPLLMLSLFSAR